MMDWTEYGGVAWCVVDSVQRSKVGLVLREVLHARMWRGDAGIHARHSQPHKVKVERVQGGVVPFLRNGAIAEILQRSTCEINLWSIFLFTAHHVVVLTVVYNTYERQQSTNF